MYGIIIRLMQGSALGTRLVTKLSHPLGPKLHCDFFIHLFPLVFFG